jgi:hypothetical protein
MTLGQYINRLFGLTVTVAFVLPSNECLKILSHVCRLHLLQCMCSRTVDCSPWAVNALAWRNNNNTCAFLVCENVRFCRLRHVKVVRTHGSSVEMTRFHAVI